MKYRLSLLTLRQDINQSFLSLESIYHTLEQAFQHSLEALLSMHLSSIIVMLSVSLAIGSPIDGAATRKRDAPESMFGKNLVKRTCGDVSAPTRPHLTPYDKRMRGVRSMANLSL